MSNSCGRSVVMTTLVRTSLVFGIWSPVKILFACSCTAKVLCPWRWRVCSFLWLHCQQAHITMHKGRQSKKGVGHTIDLSKPQYFSADDYTQHLYMILGRSQALEYSLLRNVPEDEHGDVDFSIFESGPPAYIAQFLDRLEDFAVVFLLWSHALTSFGGSIWFTCSICLFSVNGHCMFSCFFLCRGRKWHCCRSHPSSEPGSTCLAFLPQNICQNH